MSKERLEELAKKRSENRGLNKFEIDWVVRFAKEQAEREQELVRQLKTEKKKHRKTRQHFNRYKNKTSENWRAQRATKNKNIQLESVLDKRTEQAQELEQQNKRYRDALEFYADVRNHSERRGNRVFGDVFYDEGKLAREALESESE